MIHLRIIISQWWWEKNLFDLWARVSLALVYRGQEKKKWYTSSDAAPHWQDGDPVRFTWKRSAFKILHMFPSLVSIIFCQYCINLDNMLRYSKGSWSSTGEITWSVNVGAPVFKSDRFCSSSSNPPLQLLIWTLLPNSTFYLIVQGFHRTYATGVACQQRTLTPPDTWSCPTLGLACVLMSRPISPELVLSPDFWISNTPRYFSFASKACDYNVRGVQQFRRIEPTGLADTSLDSTTHPRPCIIVAAVKSNLSTFHCISSYVEKCETE